MRYLLFLSIFLYGLASYAQNGHNGVYLGHFTTGARPSASTNKYRYLYNDDSLLPQAFQISNGTSWVAVYNYVTSGSKGVNVTSSAGSTILKGDGIRYYPEDYGAVANGVTDNVTALRTCFAVAGITGGIVQFSQGNYVTSDSIPVPAYVSVQGVSGNNLGANLISANSILPALTTVTFTSPTHNGFVCGNDSGTTSPTKTGYNFSNIRVHYGGSSTPTAGAGILFGDGGNYTMDKVTVDSFFDDVYSRVACYENVTNCVFYSPARYGFVCTNLFNGDFMDINMAGCLFLSGKSYPRPLAGFYSNSPGGIKIINSKWCIPIIDTSKTFRWAIKLDNTFDVSQDILLSNLSIEAFDSSAIVMNFSNTQHQRLAILSNIQTYTIAQAIAPAIIISANTPVGLSGGVIIDNIVASNTAGGASTSFPAVQISGMNKVTIGKVIDYFYSATAGPWTATNDNPQAKYAYILDVNEADPTVTKLTSPGAMEVISDNVINTGGGGHSITFRQGGNGSAALAMIIDSLHQVDINPGSALDANGWLRVRKDSNIQVNMDIANMNTGTGAFTAVKLFASGGKNNQIIVPGGGATGGFGLVSANNLGITSNSDIAIYSFSGANVIKLGAAAAGEAMRITSTNNVLVGSTTNLPSSIFSMTSTAEGFLPPRMTLAQFTAISSPATSLHAVLTDSSGRLALWNGTKIVTYATTDMLGSGGSGVTTVGSFSGSSQTNGASISGATITFGPADATNAGMVKPSGAQTLGATLTLTNQMTFAAATTGAASFLITSSAATNPTSPTSGQLWWNGTNLNFRTGTTTIDLLTDNGVTTVASFSGSAQTNGATISGANITFGPASATVPGMVSTGAQTWAGNKLLTGQTTLGGTASAQGEAVLIGGNVSFTPAGAGETGAWLSVNNGLTSTDLAGGAKTIIGAAYIGQNTFAASSSSTITNAGTLVIGGAPLAGTNVTLTNAWAIYVVAGNSLFNGNITTNVGGIFTSTHWLGNNQTSSNPTASAGTGAGTAPTITLNGGDQDGTITVLTGTTPTGAGATVVTITYGFAFPNNSYVIITPANAITAALNGIGMVFSSATTTNWAITSGTTALTAATTYKWNYHAGGN